MKIKKSTLKKAKVPAIIIAVVVILSVVGIIVSSHSSQNEVLLQTNKGNIVIQLYSNKAPVTVKNFEDYVKSGFYSGTVFHRVIPGFVIQGGGYTSNGTQKQTNAPIKLESNNGLKNSKYTVAMARTNNPNSATSQFFINLADNTYLDYSSTNPGYAVFGKVIKGSNVVDEIASTQTTTKNGMQNWPVQNIVIEKAKLI